MILMQVREKHGGQLRSPRLGQLAAEPADQRLDPRTVAEKARSETGVDDRPAVRRLHQQTVVATLHHGPALALGGQGLAQVPVWHPGAGVKNASSGGARGGSIWPSLTTAQLSCPTANQ